ncbi:MAG TPA: DUF4386 domain-containing protein [Verrucomicrobiae bacterium]|nr:DUF4386 domain-containing protein [Verrucomicrobiae bacterium]
MSRRAAARLAGLAFLLYIAVGILTLVLSSRAMAGHGVEAKLASVAQHMLDLRIAVLFVLFTSFCALVLGVTLWGLTREQDPVLAMLALTCRVCEGLAGALGVQRTMGLLWLTGPGAPDAATARTLGTWLLEGQVSGVAAIFFSVGSVLFAWLLLRGRMIPAPLAWLGVVASAAAVVVLPLEFVDLFPGRWIWYIWLPLAAYEIPLALWLLFKGAAAPVPNRAPA